MRQLFGAVLIVAGGVCAQSGPAFEVASVKVTPGNNSGNTSFSPFGSNRYTANNAPLAFLVQLAYGVPFQQISGLEKLGDGRYDVSAKAEDGVLLNVDQIQPRLRLLLEQRFKLAVHRETKIFDGYSLVIARGGPKLQLSSGSSENGMIFPGGLRLLNSSLEDFAGSLRSVAGRPVMDKSGIAGSYDFDLRYARDGDTDSPLPSFFTALQEKYGLKLETARVPLEIIIIDHVERIPSEN
jgi:uncharacterized protein (TIGR03435 family)